MRWVSLLAVFCLSISIAFGQDASEFLKVRIHDHTNRSDGVQGAAAVMNETVEEGFDALIVTDHLDLLIKKCRSFEEYAKLFAKAPTTKKGRRLIVILGAEIAAGNQNGRTHVLALRLDSWSKDWLGLNQTDLLDLLANKNIPAVIAHPSMQGYLFDWNNAGEAHGFELMNDSKVIGNVYKDTLVKALEKISRGETIYFTAGQDTHGFANELERLGRVTWVYAKPSASSILTALAAGKGYVSQYGAMLKVRDWGELVQNDSGDVGIQFELSFGKKTTASKITNIYRDGQLINSLTLAEGQMNYPISWTDTTVLAGAHTYLIEIGDCLIASPIGVVVSLPNRPANPIPADLPRKLKGNKHGGGICIEAWTGQFWPQNGPLVMGKRTYLYKPAGQTVFQAPVYLMFKTSFWATKPEKPASFRWQMEIWEKDNEGYRKYYQSPDCYSFTDTTWQTIWQITGCGFTRRGQYQVRITDNADIIGLADFTIK
jgi:hypothetical protein